MIFISEYIYLPRDCIYWNEENEGKEKFLIEHLATKETLDYMYDTDTEIKIMWDITKVYSTDGVVIELDRNRESKVGTGRRL